MTSPVALRADLVCYYSLPHGCKTLSFSQQNFLSTGSKIYEDIMGSLREQIGFLFFDQSSAARLLYNFKKCTAITSFANNPNREGMGTRLSIIFANSCPNIDIYMPNDQVAPALNCLAIAMNSGMIATVSNGRDQTVIVVNTDEIALIQETKV